MGNLIVKQELTKLIQAGLRFEVSQGKLQVRGNLAVLSDEDKQFLKVNKEAIISLIEDQTHDIPVIQKVNNNLPKPLSFSQQGLWLLDKISEGSNHYNLVSAFRLRGKLNYAALDQTFLTIVQRHESLRCTFLVDISGEPVQQLREVSDFNVSVEEIDASAENYELQAAQIIGEEARRVFDLTKDLLLSVRLLKLSDEEHILIVNMHHIASDGWSRGILVKEFSVLYSSFVKGEPNPLPDLSIQYSDYAYWQRQWLKGKMLEEQTNFWKAQLSGLPVLHNLPLDKARPLLQSFKGSTHTSRIPKGLLTALYELCQSEAASLFMGIHAAFSTLLSRYSNETDIVVGCPIANRERAETAELVGFFMNLLVLRSDLSQKPGFRELVRQSKKMLEEAYQYQQMPFEKLVDELKVKRNLGHNPLFQILLSLQNNQKEEISIPDLVMESVNFAGNSAKYDLSLNISENAEGLILSWEYNTDLFEASTIARMAGHFELLLMALLADPDENVFKLNMVSKEELLAMSKHLKGESVEVKSEESAINSFNCQVAHKPDETAIICNDISYNYKELGKKVNAIAALLSGQGVQSGDKVGIYLLRSMEMVATIFACFKLGAAYIPLDPVYSSGRINQIIADAQPKCIVTLQSLQKAYLKEHAKENFLCLDKSGLQEEYITSGSEYRDENVAYIIFTSGTTGKPKGIEVTHGNLTNLLKGLDISFGTGTQQRWLAQTSINFDISVLELIWPISRGHSVVLQQTNPFKLLTADQLGLAKPIDFSVMFFGADKNESGQKYDLLLKTAKFADKNDFTAIWTPERHFGEFGGAFASPSLIGAALATMTEKIGIRAGSVVLPLHDPIRVAEEWSMIDNLSGGRIGVSIASGWHPNDFVFYNSDFRDRHKQMRDKIAELKDLWNGIAVERKNGVDKNIPIKIRPYPIQKELPLWITAAGSPETFKYAGEIGANILTHMLGQSLEKLAGNIAIYHQALRDNGFSIEDKKVSLMLHTYMDVTEQTALGISEQPFKNYLRSSIQLMEPLAKETGLDINTQMDDLIEMAFRKFSKENTLIGSPESCQEMLHSIRNIGVTEVACLVDFGVESEKALKGLENILKAKELYNSHVDLIKLLHIEDQKTELDLIHEYKVTHVQMTPSQAKLIVDLHEQTPDRELSSVQYWFIGGEVINQGLVKGLSAITDARLYNMYGPTETTVWSAWREINAADIHIGQPIINTDVVLLNEFEQQVPVGVAGELYIGGSGVAKGYYNNAELTEKSFKNITTPYFGKSRFYKTGDLMKLNAYGTLEFAGRKDNQVKVNGYRIELEEIETTIARIPGVKNCKVVPVKNDNTTSLSAYVVKKDIVHGDYQDVLPEEQARPFHLSDGTLVYHQSDRQLAMMYKEIMERRIYFRHGISVPENALILDIGANVGAFSIDVSREHPDATIIAFEPIPQIFSALKKNFEHWQIKGCVLNYGASNKKEKANFHYYPEMAGMSGRFADGQTIVNAVGKYMKHDKEMLQKDASYLSEDRVEIVKSFYDTMEAQKGLSDEVEQYLSSLYKSQEVECQLTTVSEIIDELNIQAIDLLKLDVEKSECLVLEGIRSEHWSMIRQLAIEVDGDTNLGIIKNLLGEKGYDIHVDDFVMSDESAPKEENTYMLYALNPNYGQKQNDAVLERLQAQVSEATIRDFLQRELPEYMNPEDIIFVPSIPLMENGKVDMLKLKEFKPATTVSEPTIILTNKTELEIYRMWCEVLKKENIPQHLSIFEAGGSSIAIVLLHQKLQTAFNVNFSLIELFRNPTIPQQAKLIQNANGKEGVTVTKAMDKGASRRNLRATRLTNTN
jgi:natural product biosynthesis luciferase-like monooxygenase protein/FkbM family methyltransferase